MPPWADELVTFDKSDSLYSALGKLESCNGRGVSVVLASGCRIADNVLTYRLMARASERFGSPLVVVARNPFWRQLAREQGLRAHGSVPALRRARRRSFLSGPESLLDGLFTSVLPSMVGQGWPVMAAVVLLAGAALFLFVPVIHLTVRTPSEEIAGDVTVRVDLSTASGDSSSAVIPGRLIEHRFTASDFVETTGSKDVGKDRAKGEVTLINGGPVAVSVPAGTLLLTATGQHFSTTLPVSVAPFAQPYSGAAGSPTAGPFTIPNAPTAGSPTVGPLQPNSPTPGTPSVTSPALSGSTVRVGVLAVETGGKGNVPALAISKIDGDSFRALTVFNERPISGGTDTKGKTASAEDRSRLKEMLFQRAQSQSLSELTLRTRQSESLIPHSMRVQIEREEYDKAIDEEGDRLRGTVYVVADGMAFANQDINAVVEREWKKALPKGYRALPGAVTLSPPEVAEAGSRTASLRVRVTGRAEPVLETEKWTESLRGQSLEGARSWLSRVGGPLKVLKVEIWPEWAPRAFRIEVQTVQ